ncbi:MAG TPA: acetyl-CoA carboxylase biotin carboxyl carrier protein [Steroidobacteraceae bacterium]|nr:acetyl-CoA carboxylase biotin carboxyl carrier protein [Steroidobacteraceae bacterium]
MTLTAKDVAEITRLLEESDFDELTLELDGLKLAVRRKGAAAPVALESLVPATPAAQPPSAKESASLDEASVSQTITAPLLGTFYRAPKPGAPPFVEVGSPVEEETIVGIIEVMKLMNTVRAATRGRVAAILAQDGALVEYGEALMRVSKAAGA